jgi:hypothetical protein
MKIMYLLNIFNKEMIEIIVEEWFVDSIHNNYKYYLSEATKESEDVVNIFNEWWIGEMVFDEEYSSKFKKEDYFKSTNLILESCCRGFG